MGWKFQIGERKEGSLGGTAKEVGGFPGEGLGKGREVGERGFRERSLR